MFAYLAFRDLNKNLEADLHSWEFQQDRLYLKKELVPTYWAQFVVEVEAVPVESIKKAADKLKALHNLWAPFPICEFRRLELIQEQLTKIYSFEYKFLEPIKEKDWYFWTLLSKNEMIFAKQPTKLPLNEVKFSEDKETPPNRAYLKLWELLTIHKIIPKKDSTAIDFGSSPGGWTWVLSHVCKSVTSIDKARLDLRIESLPNVKYQKGDVFTMDLKKLPKHDWIFCDVICFPEKIVEQIHIWRKMQLAENFVVTIKFKERPSKLAVQELEKIEGSRLLHLNHNKNELTWILITNPLK